jgi:hypothetical protein
VPLTSLDFDSLCDGNDWKKEELSIAIVILLEGFYVVKDKAKPRNKEQPP